MRWKEKAKSIPSYPKSRGRKFMSPSAMSLIKVINIDHNSITRYITLEFQLNLTSVIHTPTHHTTIPSKTPTPSLHPTGDLLRKTFFLPRSRPLFRFQLILLKIRSLLKKTLKSSVSRKKRVSITKDLSSWLFRGKGKINGRNRPGEVVQHTIGAYRKTIVTINF